MMRQFVWRVCAGVLLSACLAEAAAAQTKTFTWQQLRDKFEAANPTLRAGQLNIDASKADEVTAHLRPNPALTAMVDQLEVLPHGGYRPFQEWLPTVSANYLYERQNKRDLRLDSVQKGTAIARSQQEDLERNLLFNLRGAFVQTLQSKAILALTRDNLAFYDNFLVVSRARFTAGDIAQLDLDRLEQARVQYETDLQTAEVNLRTSKIQLLTLLDDRTPLDQFDVTGPFDFDNTLMPLEDIRAAALASRPDLRAAMQSVEKAKADHELELSNRSTDPTFGFDVGRNPPFYIGFSVSIPLRMFDKNQGNIEHTRLNIEINQNLQKALESQVFSDVDSAYATLNSTLALLGTYKASYLDRAGRIRDTVSFSYQRGGASLLDFLNSQQEYRSVQLNYLNLVGSYMTAAGQLNLAVGREIIP
jgi:cobalt-zinc-cadmium efflux system outer membrane protein